MTELEQQVPKKGPRPNGPRPYFSLTPSDGDGYETRMEGYSYVDGRFSGDEN